MIWGPGPSDEAIDLIQAQIQTILEKAHRLDPHDPKLEALREIIRDKQRLPNNKVMLFSSFSAHSFISIRTSQGRWRPRRHGSRRDTGRRTYCAQESL